MSIRIKGATNEADVNSSNQLKVVTETNVDTNPANVGATKFFSENDSGTKTGTPYLYSPETDEDFRLRVSQDAMLDNETFNYTAQNTGKHTYANTTITNTWTTAGMTTNGSGVTTTGTGTSFGTYAEFPLLTSCVLYTEFTGSFTAAITTNFIIDIGLFRRGAGAAYAPTDGVYFRINAGGVFGVVNYNTVETPSLAFDFTYDINQKYQFIITASERECHFWIDNVLYATIETPTGQGSPFLSSTLPFSVRHAHTGTTGAVIQFQLNDYGVSISGSNIPNSLSNMSGAIMGAYQGLSGGTMGQLIAGTVTTGTLVKPTAAIPANASLVANLPNNLGGRIYEQLTGGLAANTDAVFASYTVPAGTVSIQGKRLKVTGIKLSGMVSTVVVGGAAFTEWYIAFGHTADSLQTTETATTKAPRRVMLPELTTNMGAAAAAGTLLVQPAYYARFDNPIYVNPGERIQLVGNKTITTAITSGVLAYTYQFDYSWE